MGKFTIRVVIELSEVEHEHELELKRTSSARLFYRAEIAKCSSHLEPNQAGSLNFLYFFTNIDNIKKTTCIPICIILIFLIF
ncbi:hypothetical protein Hanom_Chr01g00073991 [Helianthus anomalus]